MSKLHEDDIKLLPPTMQLHVQRVLDGLKALGFDPVLFDGLRTREEANKNAVLGRGIKDSVHCYGAAADIICRKHLWQCRAKKCKFYQALRKLAGAEGFVCGGDFHSVDEPHIQAVMVFRQQAFRELPVEARDEAIRAFFEMRALAKLIAAGDMTKLPRFQELYGTKADGVYGPISKTAVKRMLAPY
jgi:D-alanyl-D-alanine carboxypeptidase